MGLPTGGGSGQNLGNAYATIQLVTQHFERAGERIRQASREASREVEGIGDSADKASRDFSQSANKMKNDAGKIKDELKSLRDAALGLSALGAGITFFGSQQAREFKQMETQLRVVMGDQAKFQQQMVDLRKLADELNVPYKGVLESAAQLAPLHKSTGASLKELIILSQQLAAADPAQGIGGARVAIQEFLSGDITSIFRRFELGVTKEVYRDLLEESAGDADALVAGLQRIVGQTGFTRDALVEINKADPFPRLLSSVQEAGSKAFTPFLNNVLVPAAEGLNSFLDEMNRTNPAILEFAGGLTMVVAGSAAFLAALLKMKELYDGIRNSALAAKAAQAGVTVAVGAAAVAAGTGVGLVAARGLADAGIGDQRFASDSGMSPGDALMEIAKQALVVIVKFILDGVKLVVIAIEQLVKGFHYLLNMLKLFGSFVQELIGNLKSVLGDALMTIAGQLNRLGLDTSGMFGAGAGLSREAVTDISNARRSRGEAQQVLDGGILLNESDMGRINQNFDNISDSILQSLVTALFPPEVEQIAEEAAAQTGEVVVDAVEHALKFSSEQVEAFGEFLDDLDKIDAKAEKDRQKARSTSEKRLAEMDRKYAEDLAKFNRDIARREQKDQQKHTADLAKLRDKAAQDETKIRSDSEKRIGQILTKGSKEREDEQTRHQRSLEKIQREGREAVLKAARSLDAVGVFEAMRQQTERQQEEETQHRERMTEIAQRVQDEMAAEREAAQVRITERQAQLQQELADSAAAFAERRRQQIEDNTLRLADMAEEQARRREQEKTNLQERLNDINQQSAEERAAREQKFREQFNDLETHESRKLAIQRRGLDQLERELQLWWARQKPPQAASDPAIQQGLNRARELASGVQQTAQNVFNSLFRLGSTASTTSNTTSRTGASFNRGGAIIMDTGGRIQRRGLYNLQPGEEVIRPDIAEQLRRMMGGDISQRGLVAAISAGAAPKGVDLSGAQFVANLHDVGNMSVDQVRSATKDGMFDAIVEFMERYS